MIYVSDKNLQNSRIKEIILEKLMENNLVYIVNNNVDERESYGRLQYIKESEDLYRIPNLVLVDKYYENKDNVKGEYLEIWNSRFLDYIGEENGKGKNIRIWCLQL